MLNMLVRYKKEMGLALGMIAATATVIIFEIVFGLSSLISIPAAILAYVTVFIVWTRYLNSRPGE